ncbi:hypothetical protein BO85DRAFT_360787 [Aspergillus piperis CBS 112811]|uniref:Uncharacterized protein n=1 Tax=Aspergillus piperis CBS 112811 TaxID=1448313 RepID=A0A8G1RE11_9EURO|nr:hypothetical protein BO85DRAFT_360787 [Aspergillus piperis CBS 112811]RAH63511.1 hypothetical protein BO85DRAFT_360787 [Aspergillus piperis CBS 112811]
MEEPSRLSDLAVTPEITEQNPPECCNDAVYGGTSRGKVECGQSHIFNACYWETYQDQCEIALFLRCFSEGPGKWTGVLGSHQLYFSQNMVSLSRASPVIRYAACALGAKYLGRIKRPELKTHKNMRNIFSESQPDFIWYGAKYYNKALKLLAHQAPCDSHGITKVPLCSASQTAMTGNSSDSHGTAANIYPAIAECILFQYVDIGDVSRRRTRLDSKNLSLWRDLGGLPLNGQGDLLLDHISEHEKAALLFKSLIRLLCQLLNSNLSDAAQWVCIKSEFDRWYCIVPGWFSSPLVWACAPHECPDDDVRRPAALSATWFSSDTCALAMAFYYMGRMLLLINQPTELFLEQYGDQPDVLVTYKRLWKDLHQHAIQTLSIARGIPTDTVRKYLLQPLYLAGRCLLDTRDRLELLGIFKQIGNDLGVATEYRQRDLCEEWGYPLSMCLGQI